MAVTTAATVGFGAPAAMVQFGVKVAGLVAKVGRIIPRVIDALTELKRLLGRLGPSIGQALDNLTKLLRRGGRGSDNSPGPRSPKLDDLVSMLDKVNIKEYAGLERIGRGVLNANPPGTVSADVRITTDPATGRLTEFIVNYIVNGEPQTRTLTQ